MREAITILVQVSKVNLPEDTAKVLHDQEIRWTLIDSVGNRCAVSDLIGSACDESNVLNVSERLESAGFVVNWRCSSERSLDESGELVDVDGLTNFGKSTYDWPSEPTVLAVVPYWRCERWLPRCLHSLVNQTRLLTNIVVIDDGSEILPTEIVKAFPEVTLLSSRHSPQVGPYRLVQSVVEQVDYTAFLFQDADDWSSCDRLQTLLKTARLHCAEVVGSQEVRVLEPEKTLQAVGYPMNVNIAMRRAPGHGLLHPTSLVTRNILKRVGGFATGLRFGADSEFLLRAHWVARIVNSAEFCYFRRKRPESLTTAEETGLESPARQLLTKKIKQKAIERKHVISRGYEPDLQPLSTAPSVSLEPICGPALRWR